MPSGDEAPPSYSEFPSRSAPRDDAAFVVCYCVEIPSRYASRNNEVPRFARDDATPGCVVVLERRAPSRMVLAFLHKRDCLASVIPSKARDLVMPSRVISSSTLHPPVSTVHHVPEA